MDFHSSFQLPPNLEDGQNKANALNAKPFTFNVHAKEFSPTSKGFVQVRNYRQIDYRVWLKQTKI